MNDVLDDSILFFSPVWTFPFLIAYSAKKKSSTPTTHQRVDTLDRYAQNHRGTTVTTRGNFYFSTCSAFSSFSRRKSQALQNIITNVVEKEKNNENMMKRNSAQHNQ